MDLDALLESALDEFDEDEEEEESNSGTAREAPPSSSAGQQQQQQQEGHDVQDEKKGDGASAFPVPGALGASDSDGAIDEAELAEMVEKMMKAVATGDFQGELEEIMKGLGGDDVDPAEAAARFQQSMPDFAETAQHLEKELEGVDMESLQAAFANSGLASGGGAGGADEEALKRIAEQFEGNEQMQEMLEGMAKEMVSRDILYPPMKDLAEKFPAWIEKNRAELSAEKLESYEAQLSCCTRIVAAFERASASASGDDDELTDTVVDLLQEMQDSGEPPQDLMSELAPGLIPPGGGAPGQQACTVM